jgi:hypothetical protein
LDGHLVNELLNPNRFLERSQVIRYRVADGDVIVIGVMHDGPTGRVAFSDPPDLIEEP